MLCFIGWNRYVGQQLIQEKAIVMTMTSIPVAHSSSSSSSSSLPLLIVCGTVQNAAEHLDKIRQTLRRLMDDKFRLVDMIFYEENSRDDTVNILKSWWQLEGWNVTVLSPSVPTSTSYRDRTVRLAAGRNRLWQEIQQRLAGRRSGIDDSSYVLMMDMDDVNWHLAHADQCLNLPRGWFGCCANSYKVYYDLWALRTLDNWMDCDVVYECAFGPPTRKPFRHISASHAPIQVRSCFGGATLYNLNVLLTQRNNNNKKLNLTQQYQGRNGTRPICEHVPFHVSLQNQDPSLKLYIQPKFLNDGPSDNRMTHFGGVKKRLENQYEESFRDATLSQYYRTMNTFDR